MKNFLILFFLSCTIGNATTVVVPIADFSFEINGNTLTFTNLSSDANTYIWDFGDGNNSIEPDPVHSYAQEGKYVIKLQVANNTDVDAEVQVAVLGGNYQAIGHTANDLVTIYNAPFRPGTNLGYNPPWSDEQLADLAAGNEDFGVLGIGAKSIRPSLPEHFLEEWEYDVRLETFEHYASLGLKDNTLIVGFPSDEHRDSSFYCPEHQSETFSNMYTDIWDNGENGTPVNDDNYLALYMYKLVHLYGNEITFWEIWNEPGFDYTFQHGWLPPGTPGNWWDNNPEPCDYKLRAPIFHYVRILRICYEVINYIDPNAVITLGSVGYASFMDAVLRNTDNPNDGSATGEYPLGGGAYFDAVSIHSYPHIDGTLREWSNDIQDFVYHRHSDRAASGIAGTKNAYQTVLHDYGYNGNTFPEKQWIITELNIPRKQFGQNIGSEEAQTNYIIKSYIESIKQDIHQLHIFNLAEPLSYDDATNSFHMMGLYQILFNVLPYNETVNNEGIAYKTSSDLLFNSSYDPNQTTALNLPDSIDGAAFLDTDGHYTYVIWAKTSIDQSEVANATYSFPASLNISTLELREWDFSQTEIVSSLSGNMLSLNARPIFLKDTSNIVSIIPSAGFEVLSTTGCAPFIIEYNNTSSVNSTEWLWTFEGGTPATSTLQHPNVSYDTAGIFDVSLIASNVNGSDTLTFPNHITIDIGLPQADFNNINDSLTITFVNNSQNASSYSWDMNDGYQFDIANPTHTYDFLGYYYVTLIAHNSCGSDTTVNTILVNPEALIPIAAYSADTLSGCTPLTVQFFDESSPNSNQWFWQFENGTPENSTEQNPIVIFESPGDFFVSLVAQNQAGSDTEFIDNYISTTEDLPPLVNFTADIDANVVSFNSSVTGAISLLWNFGDNNTSTDVAPTHSYAEPGTYIVNLSATNGCGTSNILSDTIEVLFAPIAGFTATPLSGCAPITIQFQDTSQYSPDSWAWQFPGGEPAISMEASPLITYNTAGEFDIQLTVSNSSGTDLLAQGNIIIVDDLPIANFDWTVNDASISLNNTSTGYSSLLWDFGDGSTDTNPSPSHSYMTSGDYLISLIAENNCGTDTLSEIISINIISIDDINSELNCQIFPNPNSGIFTLRIESASSKDLQLRFYNVLGQKIKEEMINITAGTYQKQVDLREISGNLSNAIYWLELSGENGNLVKKLEIRGN